ncbi:hypothetical protein BDZ97DRAFT_2062919 [Flammula alnicola]|nr:hypothetical protein BDZ97DRAFT_2062919 [Flammula alnicola]
MSRSRQHFLQPLSTDFQRFDLVVVANSRTEFSRVICSQTQSLKYLSQVPTPRLMMMQASNRGTDTRPRTTAVQRQTNVSHECALCGSMQNQDIDDNDSFRCEIANMNPCDPCTKLAELDVQISKVKKALAKMQRERRNLKSKINYSHDRFIHQLPPEISSEIFHLCIPEHIIDIDLQYEPRENAISAPLILSSVCQKWRQIAQTTPKLWTSVPLRLSPKNHSSLPQLAKEWIGRSGQLLLSIRLFVHPGFLTHTAFRPLIAIINQHSTRWRHLNYEGPSSLLSDLVGNSRGASQLQTLKLRPSASRSEGRFKLTNFKPAPAMLEISQLRLKSVVIEWNNVTHVKTIHLHIDECWELFRRAPRMTHCLLEDIRKNQLHDQFPMPRTPILHPTLQVLELVPSIYYNDLFLDNVILPSLQSYTSHGDGRPLNTPSLVSLFFRSSCSLQKLSLLDVKLDDTDLVYLSRVTPELRHLKLKLYACGAYFTERIFRRFSEAFNVVGDDTEIQQTFFPQLQSMTFQGTMPSDWKTVPDIFGSPSDIHNPRRRPLRSVALTLSPTLTEPYCDLMIIDEDTLRRMLLLVEQGTELRIEDMSTDKDVLQQSIEFYARDFTLEESQGPTSNSSSAALSEEQ